jgi:membrane protease YdiL (CAAX protease family)
VCLFFWLCVFGIPFGLFKLTVANKYNIFHIINNLFLSISCFFLIKIFYREWVFGFTVQIIIKGVLQYGWFLFIICILPLIGIFFKFKSLKSNPKYLNILVWDIINFLFGAILEEIIFRGVLLNVLLMVFDNKYKIIFSIIISSAIYGIGHLYGMSYKNIKVMLMRFIQTFFLGIFFASVYAFSGNLLSVIILHWIFNISRSISFDYSSSDNPSTILTKMKNNVSLMLGIWGIILIINNF